MARVVWCGGGLCAWLAGAFSRFLSPPPSSTMLSACRRVRVSVPGSVLRVRASVLGARGGVLGGFGGVRTRGRLGAHVQCWCVQVDGACK